LLQILFSRDFSEQQVTIKKETGLEINGFRVGDQRGKSDLIMTSKPKALELGASGTFVIQ
jgi:hypothetical protein